MSVATPAARSWVILDGDCRDRLAELPAGSVHTCITSPPYFGLRDYGTARWDGGDPLHHHAPIHRPADARRWDGNLIGSGDRPRPLGAPHRAGGNAWLCECGARRVDQQIGLEPTPEEFVAALVDVFREVRRVLRDDGTVWLNLGDSYAGSWGAQSGPNASSLSATQIDAAPKCNATGSIPPCAPYKPKDLLGIPWMAAFALRADGWFLRSEIIWAKPNPMPESVIDRPTKAHEQVFLFSKSPRYFYDGDAIREAATDSGRENGRNGRDEDPCARPPNSRPRTLARLDYRQLGRNKRSVWTVSPQPYDGAHFATFPPSLIDPCILAGAPEKACALCGAPWARLTERSSSHESGSGRSGRVPAGKGNPQQGGGDVRLGPVVSVRTLGFAPTCEHHDGSATGVVLDPFAGAGTTLMVAVRRGRSAVGIELNADYAALARDRIETDIRLGARAPQRGPEIPDHQPSLFDHTPAEEAA